MLGFHGLLYHPMLNYGLSFMLWSNLCTIICDHNCVNCPLLHVLSFLDDFLADYILMFVVAAPELCGL